jgi:urease alpha subunit
MRALSAGLIFIVAVSVWAADNIQALNVKPGLWETTSTVTRSGEMPIPAEFLARMTPDQRAKLEARMKANSTQNTRTHTYRTCETKEKLKRTPFSDAKECTLNVVSSTSSKAELRVSCQTEGLKTSGDMLVEALSTESIKGSGHMTAAGGGHSMNMNTTLSSKWLGSSCGDVK